ncbi:MAG: hypothetical protein KTR25_18545 [Myxococcales bacterium]|nr:hypothetical protein [Myxococcales bacterium]
MSQPKASEADRFQPLVQKLVVQLHTVLRMLQVHDFRNRTLLIATEYLRETINAMRTLQNGDLQLKFVDGVVYINEKHIRIDPRLKEQVAGVQEEFDQRGMSVVSFSRPVEAGALEEFLSAFSQPRDSSEATEASGDSLQALHARASELLEPIYILGGDTPETLGTDLKTFALHTYARAVLSVRDFLSRRSPGEVSDRRLNTTSIVQNLVELTARRMSFLLRLAVVKTEDNYVSHHAVNTCVFSIVIGRAIGLDRVSLLDLGTAALLADMGFALLPSDVLEDTGEWSVDHRMRLREEIDSHSWVYFGQSRLSDSDLRGMIVASEHHRPFRHSISGQSGYTHLFSRIVQVADVFDALTTRRPWREGYTADEALRILVKGAGQEFDPLVVKVLVNILGLYPLGSTVRLGSGEIAVVYHNSSDPNFFLGPWVRVVRDREGQVVTKTLIRNLAETEGPEGRIVAFVQADELEGFGEAEAIFV